jgi:hypothetical protein
VLPLIPADGLFCLKKPGAAWNSDGFQGGADRQADGLIGAGRVRNEQICPERVISAVDTLDGRIKGFHVDGNIDIFSRDAGFAVFVHGSLLTQDCNSGDIYELTGTLKWNFMYFMIRRQMRAVNLKVLKSSINIPEPLQILCSAAVIISKDFKRCISIKSSIYASSRLQSPYFSGFMTLHLFIFPSNFTKKLFYFSITSFNIFNLYLFFLIMHLCLKTCFSVFKEQKADF